jgi:flavodoxin
MKTGKRILVVYYSLGGNTARVGNDLAMRLGADTERLQESTPRRGVWGYVRAVFDSLREKIVMLEAFGKCADDYSLVIVGTPVWAGKLTPAVRTYLKIIRGRCRRVAFFTTSGATDPAEIVPAMEKLVGLPARAFTGFTDRELRDAAIYERKLGAFVESLKGLPAAAPGSAGLEHAHA